jgi:hypothetical protein
MKFGQILKAAGILFAAWIAPWSAAHADMVVFDSMSFFQGQQAFTQTFDVTTAGTLSVSTTEVPWLDSVTNLSFFLTSPTGTMGQTLTGAGNELFNIKPGTYTANWFGNAEGLYNMGVVGVDVTFYPTGTPVPLPASILLMLSGLGLLFAWPRVVPTLPAPVANRG